MRPARSPRSAVPARGRVPRCPLVRSPTVLRGCGPEGSSPAADTDGGRRGSGQERSQRDDQREHQHHPPGGAKRSHDDVEACGGSRGPGRRHGSDQQPSRHQQPGGEQDQGQRDAEACRDQRAHPYPRQIDAHRQHQQRDPRQHRGERVQGVGRLGAYQLVGCHEGDRRVRLRDNVDRRQPFGGEPLLRGVDEGCEVQAHRSALDDDRLSVTRQHSDQLLMGAREGPVPGRSKLGARHPAGRPCPRTNPFTAVASAGVKVFKSWTSSGRRPCAASAASDWSARLCTSTYWKTVVVTRFVNASCTAGSSIKGPAVATKWSVSESSLWVQTATSDTGASTQPMTINTTARTDRQRIRRRGRLTSARSVSFSRRSRLSSARSSAVRWAGSRGTRSRGSVPGTSGSFGLVGGGNSGFLPPLPRASPVSDERPVALAAGRRRGHSGSATSATDVRRLHPDGVTTARHNRPTVRPHGHPQSGHPTTPGDHRDGQAATPSSGAGVDIRSPGMGGAASGERT